MKITICGSIKLAKEMQYIGNKLTHNLHTVTLPSNLENYIDVKNAEENKWNKLEQDVFKSYYKKIERSDAILVVNMDKNNIENYIGGNSLIEMAFAHILDKEIYLLNPIPQMSYTEEIKSFTPIIINGDLNKIQ